MIPLPAHLQYDVAIVGLGYVGIPLALGFVEAGLRVLGLDTDEGRLLELQQGHSPLAHLPSAKIAGALATGRLHFTDDSDRI